jgi:L-lactate dehydrogenase complex protein LldG
MSTAAVDEFQDALSDRGADSTVVSPAEADEAIREALAEPAVASPSAIDGVSFTNLPVTVEPSPAELRAAETGLTASRLGISSLGTVAVESREGGDEFVGLFPERHVVVVRERDLTPDLSSAFSFLTAEFEAGRDSVVFATGPSATGDMGALVQGVHGPKTVHVIVVTDDE